MEKTKKTENSPNADASLLYRLKKNTIDSAGGVTSERNIFSLSNCYFDATKSVSIGKIPIDIAISFGGRITVTCIK